MSNKITLIQLYNNPDILTSMSIDNIENNLMNQLWVKVIDLNNNPFIVGEREIKLISEIDTPTDL